VSKEIVDNLSDQEKRRQEAINELINTERDFVRDMEYLRTVCSLFTPFSIVCTNENAQVWIGPLRVRDIIPEQRRAGFIEQVFGTIHDIIRVNTRLRDALDTRQKSHAIIEGVADIFLDVVPLLSPFVSYSSQKPCGEYGFEKEKSSNPAFAQFARVRLPSESFLHFGRPTHGLGLGNGAPARIPQAQAQRVSRHADDPSCPLPAPP
jgi:hypothetical protein